MDRHMPDGQLDRLIARYLAERDDEIVAGARSAAEVARAGSALIGQGATEPVVAARVARQLVMALLLAGLLAALATASVLVGSRPVSTDPDPLAGWVTEEVGPGIVRVVSDGIRDLAPVGSDPGHEMALGLDGSTWVWSEGMLDRLGDSDPPVDGLLDVRGLADLKVDPDGVLWAAGSGGVYRLDEGAWTRLRPVSSRLDIVPDGTVWSAWPWSRLARAAGVSRFTPSGREDHPIDLDIASALGVDPSAVAGYGVKGFRAAPDGTVWVGVAVRYGAPSPNRDGFGHLLLRFDGRAWSAMDPLGVGSYFDMDYFDIGSDGTAWMYLDVGGAGGDPQLARLADGAWTVYSSDDGVTAIGIRGEVPGFLEAGPDGTVWIDQLMDSPGVCRGVRSFDGTEWDRYLDGICVVDLDIGPDGAVWVVGARDPQRGDPRRDAGDTYRIDPR